MECLTYSNTSFLLKQNTKMENMEKINFKKFKNNTCSYCKKTIRVWRDKTIDHILPTDRGGIDSPSNWQITCEHCNREKSNMTDAEYREYKKITSNLNTSMKSKIRNEILKQIKISKVVDWITISNMCNIFLNFKDEFDELEDEKADLIEEIKKLKVSRDNIEIELNTLKERECSIAKNIETLQIKHNKKDSIYTIDAEDIEVIATARNENNNILKSEKLMDEVNKVIERYKKYGILEPITLYKNILVDASIEYVAYCKILNLDKVKIKNIINIANLNKKTIKKILHNNLDLLNR